MRCFVVAICLVALAGCGPSPQTPAPQSRPGASAAETDVAAMQARVAALSAPYNGADFEAGRRVFAQCRSCHTVQHGAGNRVGPNLHGLFGREVAAAEGFAYSQPLQDADFTWDGERLDHWLENPRTFLPGNRMAFAGVRDETQRRDLIAYLMVASSSE